MGSCSYVKEENEVFKLEIIVDVLEDVLSSPKGSIFIFIIMYLHDLNHSLFECPAMKKERKIKLFQLPFFDKIFT